MKTKSILFAVMSLLMTVFISSCSSDSKDKEVDEAITVTGISVDKDALTLEVESTEVLEATLQPEGATGAITWSSSKPSVATVNKEGVVTALKIGETTIVAEYGAFTAHCEVTVTAKELDPDDLPASLTGSEYAVIQIDDVSYEAIKDRVTYDLRPDDEIKNLYIWENTYVPGTASGLNFYNQSEGWVSLAVASAGWSGAAYHYGPEFGGIDLSYMFDNPEDYVFHIALKSAGSASYILRFYDGDVEASVCFGSSNFVDGGNTFVPYTDFPRDNEWHSIEIPFTVITDLGVLYNEPINSGNLVAFLAGGVAGTTFDMDAAFFYKKAK